VGCVEKLRTALGVCLTSLLVMHIIMLISMVGVVAAWFVLASVLYIEYLPYGVAVVTIVVVARVLATRLYDAFTKLTTSLEDAFNRQLQYKLARARQRVEADAFSRLRTLADLDKADGFNAPLGALSSAAAEQSKADAKPVSGADIFALLRELRETDEDGERGFVGASVAVAGGSSSGKGGPSKRERSGEELTIGKEEFTVLFKSLDLSLSDGQIDRLFAMADLTGSQEVSQAEFESAWDDLRDEFLRASVKRLGLSPMQMWLIVASLIALLVLLIAFVLIMVGLWFDDSSLDAVFQSTLVAMLGRAATSLERTSKKARDSGEVDKLVASIMGEAEDNHVNE